MQPLLERSQLRRLLKLAPQLSLMQLLVELVSATGVMVIVVTAVPVGKEDPVVERGDGGGGRISDTMKNEEKRTIEKIFSQTFIFQNYLEVHGLIDVDVE